MAALMTVMWWSWARISDAGSVVVASDADVVQASVDAQGDGSGLVDAVGADAVVRVELGLELSGGARGWRKRLPTPECPS